MTLTPEIVAKLIYGISQLRYWEKEYAKEPGSELRRIVMLWQDRLDELIEQLGATEFISLKDLLKQIEIVDFKTTHNEYDQTKHPQQ